MNSGENKFDRQLYEFKCVRVDRFEDDIPENSERPLYDGKTGGFAFIDKNGLTHPVK